MSSTKEAILFASLRLFAQDGYEAASVSRIAGALKLTKSALYRHFSSKRDIFDEIVARMERLDAERAAAYDVPLETMENDPAAYQTSSLERFLSFSLAQFRYWTEEPFPALFRRLLTLEQYRTPEMAALYRRYFSAGPLAYTEDLLFAQTGDRAYARRAALAFYGPMHLMYAVYDAAEDKAAATASIEAYLTECIKKMEENV